MTSRANFKSLKIGAAMFLGVFALACGAMADDTNTTTNATTNIEARIVETAVLNSQAALRASLEVQDQLRKTQIAIEKDHQEAEAAAARNAELIKEIGLLFNSNHRDEMQEMQHSNRNMLVASGAFLGLGFVVLLFASLLQWSTFSRLKVVVSRLPASLAMEAGLPALAIGDAPVGPGPAVQSGTRHFLELVERLEKRLSDMENGTPHKALGEGNGANGESHGENADALPAPASDSMKTVTVMLSKGQTLLKLDQPEGALVCFDEALSIDAGNTEALLKKGAALERLQRLDEAISCYDQAIAKDNSITMAYLYKGGVFNRLERYNEALECYEQALKTQEKGRPVGAVVE